MQNKKYKASVTVFLSMIMLLLIGVVMCLIEVTRIHNLNSYNRIQAEGAIESVFAEYHKELRENYGLFGLDASYRGNGFSSDNVLERFSFYGGLGDESTIESLQLITDNQGSAFLDQIMFYMADSTGLSYFDEMLDMTIEWESMEIDEGGKGENGLTDLGSLKDAVDEEVENPLGALMDFDFNGILNVVVKDKDSLSNGSIELNTLCSQRQLEVGYGNSISLDRNTITTKLAVSEYAMDVLSNACIFLDNRDVEEEMGDSTTDLAAGEDDQKSGLAYELEYLIGGKNSDKENLKSVVHKLLLIRTPVNYACLQGDSTKKAEVNVLAASIALATGAVGTESIIAESLLWAWSYVESMADVKSLLSGYALSPTKKVEQWQLGLLSILTFGNSNFNINENTEGMDYKDFLRILLYLESIETLTLRTMDMVELGVRGMEGLGGFQLDYCISRMKMEVKAQVATGYNYRFPIEYGYR